MINNMNILNVESGEENCPADALMNDFRKRINSNSEEKFTYSKNIEFSKECIKFFCKMADTVERSSNNIKFQWDAIPEAGLPPLIVKVSRKNGKYRLQYLKELGDKTTLIKGKQRKGKNKYGKTIVNKEIKIEGSER